MGNGWELGTTAPVNKQHIVASSNGDGLLLERDSSTLDDNVGLLFKVAANDLDEYKKAGIFFSGLAASGKGNLIFATNNVNDASNVTTADARMVITIAGNVGIGTIAPSQQLEITKNFSLPATSGTTPYGIIYKDGSRFIHDFNYGDNGSNYWSEYFCWDKCW